MAKQNTINKATGDLTIDPGASGDSFVQFNINTTGEFRIGVDDDDADSFKISQGNALGTNDTFIITAAGECKLPLQPSFCALNSAGDANVTGDGTEYTVICDTEIWDQSADYNNGTGVFTAPITGRYLFSATCLLDQVAVGHTSVLLKIDASNRYATGNGYNLTAGMQAGSQYWTIGSFMDMDAADTATFKVTVSGSTKTVDVYGAATHLFTSFSGSLFC